MLILLLALIGQGEYEPFQHIEYIRIDIERRPYLVCDFLNTLPEDVEQFLPPVTGEDFHIERIEQISSSVSSHEDLFVYEVRLAQALEYFNYQATELGYNRTITIAQQYLNRFPDSIPIALGGELRAYVLYRIGEAKYYASFVPGSFSEIKSHTMREEARELYQNLMQTYPESYVYDHAWVSWAWFRLEANQFSQADEEFRSVYLLTSDPHVGALAAYGRGLALMCQDEYLMASQWFYTEDDYPEKLGIVSNGLNARLATPYSETADSLIASSLWYFGRCFEALGNYSEDSVEIYRKSAATYARDRDASPFKERIIKAWFWIIDRLLFTRKGRFADVQAFNGYRIALDTYQHILGLYPERVESGFSISRMVNLYLMAQMPEQAEGIVREAASRSSLYPDVYDYAYEEGLFFLSDYYYSIGANDIAIEFAERYYSETGNSESLEMMYFQEAMACTTVIDIGSLKYNVQKIRQYNPESVYLVGLLYNLASLLITDEDFEEARQVLASLISWPDNTEVYYMMPDAIFLMGRAHLLENRYQDAAAQYELWISQYEFGELARPDLTPNVLFNLGYSYFALAQEEKSPQLRNEYYRKAIEAMEHLEADYSDTELYLDSKSSIDRIIQQARRGLG